jgi:uncharacterized membrane protein
MVIFILIGSTVFTLVFRGMDGDLWIESMLTSLPGGAVGFLIAVTVFIIWWIDNKTRAISRFVFHDDLPFVGVLIAIVVIYIVGLIATSVLGKYALRLVDKTLSRVPLLRELYMGWKQISFTPGGGEGIFARVALVPDESGETLLLGFTSGQPIEGDPNTLCVFIPTAPNPMNGRLHFVRRERCKLVNTSAEEAFKLLLSTGNYTPPQLGTASAEWSAIPAKPGASAPG